jgi:hypothetical protein
VRGAALLLPDGVIAGIGERLSGRAVCVRLPVPVLCHSYRAQDLLSARDFGMVCQRYCHGRA